jgi:AcrR family transcriptional regulator
MVAQQRVEPPTGRAQVVQASVDLALAGGYSAVSWEAVSARSGLGLREVQRHATTIDDLLLLTVEDRLQRWMSAAPTWTRVDPVPGLSDEISRRLLTGLDAAAECPEFWALGILLSLTAGHGAHRARARYAAVRADARAAIAEWWARILPPEAVEADPRLPHRLTGVHLALVDGAFVAQQSGVEWNLPMLIRTVSAGLSSYVDARVQA